MGKKLNAKINNTDIMNELAKIGFSSMEHFTRQTDQGDLVIDTTKTTKSQLAAVREVKYRRTTLKGDEEGFAEDIGIKLYDKQAALVNMGKELGMFVRKVELDAKVNLADRMRNARNRAKSGDSAA